MMGVTYGKETISHKEKNSLAQNDASMMGLYYCDTGKPDTAKILLDTLE